MVIVDAHCCAYCGGCVSVCPVEALTLEEARLVVDETCIDCEDCITACPVGALSPGLGTQPSPKAPLRRGYDLVVVGAGPGGSLAAQTAAQAGLSVLLIEKRQEIGSPVRCAEGVGHDRLAVFLEPDVRWVSAEITKAEITTMAGDKPQVLRAEGGRGYILERRVFDRALAERAAQAGAEVRVKTAATGLIIENSQVRGIKIRHGNYFSGNGEVEVEAHLVIAADGVESQVGRWAGLDTHLPLGDTMVCAQYLLAGIDIDPTCTSYWINYEIAPGGYAWVFSKGEGRANVGLGVQADLWQVTGPHSADQLGQKTALSYLTRFIESQPLLAQGYPVTLVAGNVPVALSPERMVTDGLMLVGDAARQVDALTGGGIINAMSAGQLAARVAVEAIEAGDTSANFLSRYETAWEQGEGRKLKRNYRLREKFPPEIRTAERFIQAFALAVQ
jgi:digeranylgeranylglycerophospholipid reductase